MTLVGQTAFVTGATGFLGGALTRALADRGVQVRALVRDEARADYIRDQPGVEVVLGDITDAERMRDLARGCALVFHVAAALNGTYAHQTHVNVTGTQHVVQAAADAGAARLVHISSIAVYGYRVRGDVTEEMPPRARHDTYGITKGHAEVVVRQIAALHAMPYTILRPGMIYGPRSGAWTGQMFRLARLRPTPFVGDGSGSCFPIHVDDVVGLTLHAADHPAAANQTFNITPDPSPTWREFLGAYSALAGHHAWLPIPPLLLKPVAWGAGLLMPPDSPLKALPDLLPFSQRTVHFRMDKARRRLDWENRVDLETGIASTAPWLHARGLLRQREARRFFGRRKRESAS